MSLVRTASPSPARSEFPSRAEQRARAALRRNIERMAELNGQSRFLADVSGIARSAAPAADTAAWPGDIAELSATIARQAAGGRRPFEQPVTNADRDLVKKNLPRGAVEMNDPVLDAPRRSGDPRYC